MKAKEPAKLPRNLTIDGLKYVAAAAIVLHHTSAYAGWGFLVTAAATALFLFFAISGYLHGPIGGRGLDWLRRRVDRLGIPYAGWTLFFLAWGQRSLLLSGGSPFLPKAVDVIFFAGAHGILWSLVLLIYIAIGVELLIRNEASRRLAIGILIPCTLIIYWSGYYDTIVTSPLGNFLLGARYILAYLGGMEIRAAGPRKLPAWFFQAAPVALIAVLATLRLNDQLIPHYLYLSLESTIWIAASLLLVRGAATGVKYGVERLAWGRDYLIGVYVSHVVFLSLAAERFPPPTSGIVAGGIWIGTVWAFSLAAASLTVWILKSNRFTRPIVI